MTAVKVNDPARFYLSSCAQHEPTWQHEYETVLALVKVFGSLFKCAEVAEKAMLLRGTELEQSAEDSAERRAIEAALVNLEHIKAELVEFSRRVCASTTRQPRDEEPVDSLPPYQITRSPSNPDHNKRSPSGTPAKILLVDDTETVLRVMKKALEDQNFMVVQATSVREALTQIVAQQFDVLITDLHMPGPGDGFAVVTAMRHAQPEALTLVVSGFPDVQEAMSALQLPADKVLVKPCKVNQVADLIRKKATKSKPSPRAAKESVASILERDLTVTIRSWLSRVKQVQDLASISLTDEQRTNYLPEMIRDIAARLRRDRTAEAVASPSIAAVAHGKLRNQQGYTAPLIVQESRILQVSIFETLHRNLSSMDFSLVLPDIMLVADEVDSQLTQSIDSFLREAAEGAAA